MLATLDTGDSVIKRKHALRYICAQPLHHSGTLRRACLETTSLSLFHASSVQPSFVSTFVGQRPQDAHALDSLSGCVFGVHRTIRTHFFDKNLSCLPEPITEMSNLGGLLHYLCFLF